MMCSRSLCYQLDGVSTSIFNENQRIWLFQAHRSPPCFMHLLFTSLLNTFTKSSKVIHNTLIMINMLARHKLNTPNQSTLIHKMHIYLMQYMFLEQNQHLQEAMKVVAINLYENNFPYWISNIILVSPITDNLFFQCSKVVVHILNFLMNSLIFYITFVNKRFQILYYAFLRTYLSTQTFNTFT